MTAAEIIDLVHERDRLLDRIGELQATVAAIDRLLGGESPESIEAGPAPPTPPPITGRTEVSLAPRKMPKGCVTANGRGFRWQFTYQGVRYSGPTVATRDDASAGLNAALEVLAETGQLPEPEAAGPMPGVTYGSETWRDVHRFDKRMQASLAELESWRPHFDVLPAAMRQAVEARLSGLFPAQIGRRSATRRRSCERRPRPRLRRRSLRLRQGGVARRSAAGPSRNCQAGSIGMFRLCTRKAP
ncbi:MAG TPA: hypothetical protein VHG72_14050 [Polyangia bacterium]|nr:hypothetical protein [Polyangia bacterium]